MAIFVTGGAGYIGSHTVVSLINSGYRVVVLDNLSNAKAEVFNRIKTLTNVMPTFIEGDIRDKNLLKDIFIQNEIESVIHFAGLKSVADGQMDPLKYYDNNVLGTVCLLEEMKHASIKSLVFSSSATVYGIPQFLPYTEEHPLKPINVYGQTKYMIEQVLSDMVTSDPGWSIGILRYFNPVGAHDSGLIGEDPSGVPNNLMPFLAQVAVGKQDCLLIYGDDYPTEDGTGKRDYVHVDDLASGHIACLEYLKKSAGLRVVNLGTGKSTSVLELISAFEKASNITIPYKLAARRDGDLPEYYADSQYAKKILGWQAQYGIDRMCADTWRWQSLNPKGF